MASLSRSIADLFRGGDGRRHGRRAARFGSTRPAVERLEARTLLAVTPPPTVSLTQDTGASATDGITSIGSLAITSAEGATVEYSINAGKTWSGSFTAKEGLNSVRVRQTLPGTAPSAPTTFGFTLDTTVPAPLTVSLARDTGTSATDRITNDGTLSFVNPVTRKTSLETGATVQYWNAVTQDWGTSFVLAEGLNTVKVRQVDKAGNASAETQLDFSLDRAVPVAPGVALTNDTNVPDDRVTSDGMLTAATSGPNAVEPNASLQYSTTNGKTWSGTFVPKSGVNSVQVQQIDLAGNRSPATTIAFTLDKTAPAKPMVTLLADTGSSTVDRVTKDGTLSFVSPSTKKTSLEANAAVDYATLLVDGKTWSAWTPTFSAVEGQNTVKIRQIDTAGNVSPESSPLSFTLLPQPPAITAVTGPAVKTYAYGASLAFDVTFSRPVFVAPLTGASAALDVTIGQASRKAGYVRGSGTTTLTFSTPVLAGDQGPVAVVGTIFLPTVGKVTASLRDLAGNAAPTTFAPAELTGVSVDALVPVITSLQFDIASKTATVEFSRPVSGVSVGDFRIQGSVSGTTFFLPLTDARVVAQIGQATVTGGGTTWNLSVARLPSGSGSFALFVVAANSGIVDTEVGNPLLADRSTSLTV